MTRGGGPLPATRRAMLGLTMAAVGTGARAQTTEAAYPNRPVRIIIPSAPGGPTDVMARMISPALTATLGQPVIIENKPLHSNHAMHTLYSAEVRKECKQCEMGGAQHLHCYGFTHRSGKGARYALGMFQYTL